MPMLPAFCDSCGTVFSSGFFFQNAQNITLNGNLSGPCPNCGGMGHIPDGVFNFVEDTIQILSAPDRTLQELTKLARIIYDAREKAQSSSEVKARVNAEVPSLSSLLKLLPDTKSELYGFIALLLTLIQMYQATLQKPSSTTVNVTQVVEMTINRTVPERLERKKKIGRNDPCPCGSGTKFKKCCGSTMPNYTSVSSP